MTDKIVPTKFTLDNVITSRYNDPVLGWVDHNFMLSSTQIENVLSVLGKGRHLKTKIMLRRFIKFAKGYSTKGYSQFSRIQFDGDTVTVAELDGNTVSLVINAIRMQY